MRFGVSLCFLSFAVSSYLPQSSSAAFEATSVLQNANHIFNSIHSGMRQWGSSLNHNGMSAFVARVPEGTQFYHGTGWKDPIDGMEWLAFEPEHALMFARPHGPLPPHGEHPSKDGEEAPFHRSKYPKDGLHIAKGPEGRPQKPLDRPGSKPGNPPGRKPPPGGKRPNGKPGFLHTYKTKKDLRLLYVDGMSAGKTSNGTLDFQDFAILGWNYTTAPFIEYERAGELCNLTQTAWKGSIDGILRMEAGFEIIMCDFTANLDVVAIARVGNDTASWDGVGDGMFAYWRAITDRYHDIGGDRVSLNFDHFVSAYSYGFDVISEDIPRLNGLPKDELVQIRADIDTMIVEEKESKHNWQATVDLIVTRYARRLQYWISDAVASSPPSFLQTELETTLRPFIDYDNRNTTAEMARCTGHFLPKSSSSDGLAAIAVTEVSHKLCNTLFAVLPAADQDRAQQELKALVDWLQWTTWKECSGCGYDEVCVVPIWPWGSKEDHDKPSCADATSIRTKYGYWGTPRRNHGGPDGKPPGEKPDGPRNIKTVSLER